MIVYHEKLATYDPGLNLREDDCSNTRRTLYAYYQRCTSRQAWQKLRDDIKQRGILEPVIVLYRSKGHNLCTYKLHLHTGNQRWGVAHELGIPHLKAIICSFHDELVPPEYVTRELYDQSELEACFKDEACPGLIALRAFFKDGRVQFRARVRRKV